MKWRGALRRMRGDMPAGIETASMRVESVGEMLAAIQAWPLIVLKVGISLAGEHAIAPWRYSLEAKCAQQQRRRRRRKCVKPLLST